MFFLTRFQHNLYGNELQIEIYDLIKALIMELLTILYF